MSGGFSNPLRTRAKQWKGMGSGGLIRADTGRLDADTDMVSRLPPPVTAVVGLSARRGQAAAGRAVQVDPRLTALGPSACSLNVMNRFHDLLSISTCTATRRCCSLRVSVRRAGGTKNR